MKYIKYDDDNSYVDDIKEIIKDFDSYQFINDKLDIILKSIDKDIRYVSLNNDDDIYQYLDIVLYDDYHVYGFDYDNKNYPLLSFRCNKITIDDIDTIIRFNNDIVLDLSLFDFNNFVKIE